MKHKVTRFMCMALLLTAHSLAFVSPTSAEVVVNYWETFPASTYDGCNQEWLEGTVELHVLYIYNEGRVDSVHSFTRATYTGVTTGNRYLLRTNYKQDFSNYVCGGKATASANARLISQGNAPNSHANYQITYEFDANCNPLPPDIAIEVRCK